MSNNRITPFVKRMRTTGGTIYTFSSAVEDIGLNISERNNVVKISHFALLNIPTINEPTSLPENRFNITAIPSAFEYWKTTPSIKDGRVLIAESFQNYALNLEANLLNQDDYDSTLSKTVSERVFWKWLKETGAIRWGNPSNGYWMETEDADGSLGYNSVVKYFGRVSAGNVRSDSFGTYNETYVLVPTSHGQMEPFFEQIEDNNYHHGMIIQDLGENILGRETWIKPHPDGLSFRGYYDYIDSSSKVWAAGSYNMTVDGSSGGWYSGEGINPVYENAYFTDTSAYILSGIYDSSIRYDSGSDSIEFLRSKVDCVGLVLDLDKLKTIYGVPNLTFDDLATPGDGSVGSINDTFEFNAVLIYYSVYNAVQDTVLATNLLGVLFIDAPSGSTQNIGFDGILLPSLEKIQSGVGGFGTSYNLRLNIKSDNIVDNTSATIVDYATSDQLYAEDWNQAFYELGRAVNILTQNNSVLNYISEQYLGLQNSQQQMMNQLVALQYQVNDIAVDIKGTAGTVALFSDGDDPLIDSSIFQKNGKIGFFNDKPTWPVQVDASLKAKDVYIEKSIKDTSGNILIGYGSPLQLGSTTVDREMTLNTNGVLGPAIAIDPLNNVIIDGSVTFKKDVRLDGSLYVGGQPFISVAEQFVPNASIGIPALHTVYWNNGFLEASVGAGGGGVTDHALLTNLAYATSGHTGFEAALGNPGVNGYVLSSTVGGIRSWVPQSGGGGVTQGDLDTLNASVGNALVPYATTYSMNVALWPYATNASIGLAGFAKTSTLSNYLPKSGGTMTGPLVIDSCVYSTGSYAVQFGTTNLSTSHGIMTGTTDIQCPATRTIMPSMQYTITPKGTKLFIMFSAPIRWTASAWYLTNFYVYINEVEKRHCNIQYYNGINNVSFQHMELVTPGVSYTVDIRWVGQSTTVKQYGASDSERILTVIDLY